LAAHWGEARFTDGWKAMFDYGPEALADRLDN
jgi:hypothetical protein